MAEPRDWATTIGWNEEEEEVPPQQGRDWASQAGWEEEEPQPIVRSGRAIGGAPAAEARLVNAPPEEEGLGLIDYVADAVGQTFTGMAAVGLEVSEGFWDLTEWVAPDGTWVDDLARHGQASVAGLKANLPDPNTIVGQMMRDTSELLTGAIPLNRVATAFKVPRAIGSIARVFGWSPQVAAVAGRTITAEMSMLLSSQLLFDPYEGRLSSWLAEIDPEVGQIVRAFLVSSPDDSEMTARLKMALEDMGLGLAAGAVFSLLHGIRRSVSASGRPLRAIPELPSIRQMGAFWTNDRYQHFLQTLGDPNTSVWAAASAAEDLAYRNAASLIRQTIEANPDSAKIRPGVEQRVANEAVRMYSEALKAVDRGLTPEQIVALTSRLRRRITDEWEKAPGINTFAGQGILGDMRLLRQGVQETISDTLHRFGEWASRALVDRSAPLIARLGDTPAGRRARDAFHALSGAPAQADMYFQRYRNAIYRPLSFGTRDFEVIEGGARDHPLVPNLAMREADHEALDYIIALRRNISIAGRNLDYTFDVPMVETGAADIDRMRLQGVDALDAMESALLQLRRQIGPERYNALNARATEYFRAMREQLALLYDEGIISAEQFAAMARNEYAPLDLIRTIDPGVKNINGMQVSVPNSGIRELSEDGGATMNMHSADLLSQVVSRTQGVIAKNRANRALYAWLRQNPDNGWLHLTRSSVPRGRSVTPIAFMDRGEPVIMYMDNEFVDQWQTHGVEMNTTVARAVQMLTGSSLVRLTATGANPEFALVSFPRDLLYTWMTSGQYSPILPIALFQQARNFISVISDAATRTGRYVAYIQEGGGMSFLSHGERFTGLASRPGPGPAGGTIRGTVRRMWGLTKGTWHQLRNALSFINETGEIASRLMVREQAIRNGMTPREATAAARRYLDYSRGGWLTKHVDLAIPYFNASAQGLRGMIREAVNNPQEFMFKAAQFVGASAFLWLHNNQNHRDTMQAVSDHEQARYQVIPLGLTRTDANGNVMHGYARIPVEPAVIPLHGLVNAWLEREIYGNAPDPGLLADLARNWSIISEQTMLPPALDALTTYAFNIDTYTGGEVWTGARVDPEAEVNYYPHPNPTAPIMIDAGSILGMSPVRLEAAMNSLVARNLYVDLAGAAYNAIRADPENQAPINQATEMLISEYPFLRRFMHWAYPREFYEQLNQFSQYEATQSLRWNQDLDALVAAAVAELDGQPVTQEFIAEFLREGGPAQSYISSQLPLLEQERAYDRLITELRIREVTTRYSNMAPEARAAFSPNVTSVSWWSRLQWADAEARAQIIYNELRATDPARREQFMRDVTYLLGMSDGFAARLHQLLERDGRSYDGWIEGAYDTLDPEEEE